MLTDDEIAGLFERVSQGLDPEVSAIVAQGEQQGRRLRRRRRIAAAAGSAFAIAAVAGIGLAGGMHQAHPSRASVAAGGPAGAPGRPGHASPPVRPGLPRATASPKMSTGPGMTRHQMLATLRRLLPAGSALSHVVTDTSRGALEVDYNDGAGPVDLMIDVSRTWMTAQGATSWRASKSGASPGSAGRILRKVPLNCPDPLWTDEGTRPAGALPISCVMRQLADGSVERDAVMYADEFGFYGYDIYDLRPDGVTVFIQVANGINHLLPHVDRPRPPGSMAEWRALVENPAWHL